MAGGNNRDRVLAIRRAHRPNGAWIADLLGNLAIAARLSVRDGQQRLPNLFLKVRASKIQFQLEAISRAGKVFLQLLNGTHKNRVVRGFVHRAQPHPVWLVVFPEDGRQSCIFRHQLQFADRRRQGGEGVGHAGGLRRRAEQRLSILPRRGGAIRNRDHTCLCF